MIYTTVTVDPGTIRCGDIVRVDGTARGVRDMRALHGGAKLLIFTHGPAHILRGHASLTAYRPRTATG